MKLLRIGFSPLIISLLISLSCFSTAQPVGGKAENEFVKFAPLSSLEGSLLFKAAVNVFGEYYSGLILIKEVPSDSAIHVVFLSELGLNLMDIAFFKEKIEVVSVQEFINRPSLIKILKNDFQTLLLDLSLVEKYKMKEKDDGVTEVLKFRYKSQRYAYHYRENLGTVYIRRRKGLFGKVDFRISIPEPNGNSGQESRQIGIQHRGIRLKIDLTELTRL
jgi:hypothetical protein